MSHPVGVWSDSAAAAGRWSRTVPPPPGDAPGATRAPLGQYEGVFLPLRHPLPGVVDEGSAPQTTPKEPASLRFTDSSDDYSGYLTKEQLERHKQRRDEAGITEEGEGEGEVRAYQARGPQHEGPGLRQRVAWFGAKVRRSLLFFRERVRAMTWKQLLWVCLLVLLVMAGNAMQILMLNFWLHIFKEAGVPGNYTAFAVPGILFALFFVLALAVYVAVKRPNLKFAGHRYGWQLLIGVGFCDTFNSWLATYAASDTSEVLQALFTNLCPLYAVFMSKWILHDPRTYFNGPIVSVFVLTIVGILIASVYGIVATGDMGKGKIWVFVFFLSIPFRVLMNVWQSLYMIVYTRDPAFTEWLGRRIWRGARSLETADVHNAVGGGRRLDSNGSQHDTASGLPPVPVQLDDGLADDIILDEGSSAEESEGSARMIIAPPPSVCPSELPEDRERNLSINAISFEKPHREQHPDGFVAPSPSVRNVSLFTMGDAYHDNNHDSGGGSSRPLPLMPTAPPQAVLQEVVSVRYHQGEDMAVKLVMLAGETTAQILFTLCLLPADALPWWGNSSTVGESWKSFTDGIVCVFTVRSNFLFGFLYTLGFVFTYVGCAYLNHYSVALCSIVSQLSSPLTALLLVLVPSWNVQGGGEDTPWYMSLVAILLLCLAAFVYVVWEEQTDAQKVEGERLLKLRKLRVRPLEPEAAAPLDNAVPHSSTL